MFDNTYYYHKLFREEFPTINMDYDTFEFFYNELFELYDLELKRLIESIGLDKDYKLFSEVLDWMSDKNSYPYRLMSNKKLLELYYFGDIDAKVEYMVNNFNGMTRTEKFDLVYQYLFENEKQSFDVIFKIVEANQIFLRFLFKYVKEEDRMSVVKAFPETAYKSLRNKLNKEELEYVINEIRKTDNVFLSYDTDRYSSGIEASMILNKSPLLDKLKKMYGKSYVEKTKKSLDDDEAFVKAMLNSNVLTKIYENPYFTDDDISVVNGIVSMYEDRGEDVKGLRERIEKIKNELCKKQRSLAISVLRYSNSKEKLEEELKKYNITKDNYSNSIRGSKFLDKKLKESVLLVLSKHYGENYISVQVILDYIQEAYETNRPLEEVLKAHKVDLNLYKASLHVLKELKPAIHKLIKTSEKKYSKKSKKLMELYEKVMENKITNYDDFVNYYKVEPSRLLESFDKTPLFDNVKDLVKWYNDKDEEPKQEEKNLK